MDRLSPLRAPLAAVALVALSLVAVARVGLGFSELFSVDGSTAVGAARLAPNAGDAALTVLVGVLVASCFLAPEVASRRVLAVWGTVLAAVSLVATVAALTLTNLAVAGWNLVWGIPDLAVPALVGAGLLVLARPSSSGAPVPVPEPTVPTEQAVEAGPAVPEPDPELQPSWSEDAAAGAVWRTAGEAASGAPAQGWGSSGGATWPTAALPAGRDDPDGRTDPS